MGGKGEDLDARVASGELKEIDVNAPEKPEEAQPEPEIAEELETPEEPETPEKPEKPIPPKNDEGERRRLQEKVREQEEELERLRNRPEPVQREREVETEGLSPYKLTDASPEAEAYWDARETETGVDRKVLYSQEVTALRVNSAMRDKEKRVDSAMEAALKFGLSKSPHAVKYESEIRKVLLATPERARTNHGSVMAAIDMVVGRHLRDKQMPVTTIKKPLKPGSTTETPRVASAQSSKPKQVNLTPEQEKWAEKMGFRVDGLSNEEISERWNRKEKSFKKDKKE